MRKQSFLNLRALVLLLLGLAVIMPAMAQQGRRGDGRGANPEARLDRHLQFLDERLDLSDEQEAQIRQIMAEHRAAMQAWRQANPDATREARQAYWSEHRDATHTAIEGVLNAEQQQAFAELKAARELWGRGMRRGGDGPRGRLFEQLNLSDEQAVQIRQIMAEHRAAMQAWRQANPDATREARQAYMETQRSQVHAAIEALLTPEQLEQFRALQTLRRQRMDGWRDRRGKGQGGAQGPQGNGNTAPGAANVFDLNNHPNPFNPSTEIRFNLPEANHVTLAVYDAQGREVARLLDGQMSAGPQAVTFDAQDLPTGTYLYRLTVGSVSTSGRMVFVK